MREYALFTVATGVIIALLYWARIVFITATLSIIIAFILEPFVGLLVKIRIPRGLASFFVCVAALLVLYFVGLAAYNQLSNIASDVPALKGNISSLVENISGRVQSIEEGTARILSPRKPEPPPARVPNRAKKNSRRDPLTPILPPPPDIIPEVRIHDDRNLVFDYIYGQLGTLYQFILMASFVPFLVYFMLSWRDHLYKSFLRFFEGEDRITAARSLQGIAGMARAFVVGNFMIGVLLAIVSSGLFAAIRLPYPFLIGAISGLLSLVPYVGLVLAIAPPVLAWLASGGASTTLLLALAHRDDSPSCRDECSLSNARRSARAFESFDRDLLTDVLGFSLGCGGIGSGDSHYSRPESSLRQRCGTAKVRTISG